VQAEKMLDAAGRLFSAHRFHEVRMEDIAAEAEVGKGTLYRYFSDKEELYLALLARASKQFLGRLERVGRHKEGAGQRLTAMVSAIIGFFDDQPHLFDLIQRAEVMRVADFSWQQTRDELGRIVRHLFDEGKARGEFVLRDPELAVVMLLGALRSVIRFGTQPRPADLPVRIVETLLHGAVAEQGGRSPRQQPPFCHPEPTKV
jgi:AcrR family transcriptional regulator